MAERASSHDPVLVERITGLLAVRDGAGVLVDATLGAAGHAAALLAASSDDTVLVGFDRDPDALDLARRRLAAYGDRVMIIHAGYEDIADHVPTIIARTGPLLGVLYDLGVSSMQLDQAGRGFSFRADAPLDMRMDQSASRSAADVVNTTPEAELAMILRQLGEERYARRIAAAIARERPLTTTMELADVVTRAVPPAARYGPIHPATRTFQAVRIAVNSELERFSASLPQALELAAPAASSRRGGRIAVLSYHSLEDRIAKRFFADATAGCICPPDLPVCACGRVPLVRPVIRGVEVPDDTEIRSNARARSAKLRVVEKIAAGPVPPASSEPDKAPPR